MASPRNARGVAAIAAITVAVFGWLYAHRPEAAVGPPPTPAADIPTLPGFRSDAWFLPDDDRLGFVEIPSGPFQMGSDPRVDPRAFDNEQWPETAGPGAVDLPDFYIGRFEVTVAQFRAFVEGSGFRGDRKALEAPLDHPVAYVSWPDALAYCRWLQAKLQESERTPTELRERLREGYRVTLPSEAEWEKAARGTDGRIFPWGDEPRKDRANYGSSGTTPVASFSCPECAFPLSNMSGNVWELTRSPYRAYPFDLSLANVDLAADALFVMRGGSYGDGEQNVRAAVRGGVDPGARRPFIGFRIALSRSGT